MALCSVTKVLNHALRHVFLFDNNPVHLVTRIGFYTIF